MTATLDELALKYGTDKSSASHHYTKLYEQYFGDRRYAPTVLVELGWGGHEDPDAGGESARMWQEYFPLASVVVVDNEKKNFTGLQDPRITLHHDDQASCSVAKRAFQRHGGFDIIIDDASHLSSKTIESWKTWWPYLKPGGLYVVEDTHGAYHDWYYGPDEANPHPDKLTSTGQLTMLQWLRRMTDEVNLRPGADLFPAENGAGYPLEWIHFYYNIVFAKKAVR